MRDEVKRIVENVRRRAQTASRSSGLAPSVVLELLQAFDATEKELTDLRAAMIKAGRHAGAGVSEAVSTKFLCWTADDIIIALDTARGERQAPKWGPAPTPFEVAAHAEAHPTLDISWGVHKIKAGLWMARRLEGQGSISHMHPAQVVCRALGTHNRSLVVSTDRGSFYANRDQYEFRAVDAHGMAL